jgi:hypothetical protein
MTPDERRKTVTTVFLKALDKNVDKQLEKLVIVATEACDKATLEYFRFFVTNVMGKPMTPELEYFITWHELTSKYRKIKDAYFGHSAFFELSGELAADLSIKDAVRVLGATSPKVEKTGAHTGIIATITLSPMHEAQPFLNNADQPSAWSSNVGLAEMMVEKQTLGFDKLINPKGELRPAELPSILYFIQHQIRVDVNASLRMAGYEIRVA